MPMFTACFLNSMGGAIAVHTAAKGGVPNLAALFLIDVVEGNALTLLVHQIISLVH